MATTKNSKTSKTARTTTATAGKTARTYLKADLAPLADLAKIAERPTLTQVRDAWRATGKSQARRDVTVAHYLASTGQSARDLAKATGWSRGTIGNAQRSGDLLARMIAGGYAPSIADAADTAEVARWNADRLAKAAPKGLDKMTGGALRDALRKMIEQTGKQHAKNAKGARKSQEEKKPLPSEQVAGEATTVPLQVETLTTAKGTTDEVKAAAALKILPSIGGMVSLARAQQIAEQATRILKAAEAREAAEARKAEKERAEADAARDAAADEAAKPAPRKRAPRKAPARKAA